MVESVKLIHESLQRRSMKWSETSRHGSLRTYEISDMILTVTCHDVTQYSYSLDAEQRVRSVDPEGGPYLSVGSIVHEMWVICEIVSHHKNKSIATFVCMIQPS